MASSGTVMTDLIIIMSAFLTFGQEIAESPSDVTVFINQTAVFTCVIHGPFSYQYWRVNGTDLNRLPSDILDDLVITQVTVGGDEEFILTITGKAEYNGTRVQCVTGGGGDERESENATLNIEGLLSSVGDLNTNSSASSIIISWSAPFSLDVTGVDPDIWYSVLIYNVTDETAVSVPYPNCINISETSCVFRPHPLSPCHMYMYNFTVIPYNGAGQGESSQNISTKYLGREEGSYSPPDNPDLITVVSVSATQPTPTVAPSASVSNSSFFKGLGVGVGVGTVITSLAFVSVIMSKVLLRRHCRQEKEYNRKVPMKRNVAYELHNPVSQGNAF